MQTHLFPYMVQTKLSYKHHMNTTLLVNNYTILTVHFAFCMKKKSDINERNELSLHHLC